MKKARWLIPLAFLLAFSPILATGDPEPRIGARMIYDPVNQRILMYGGADWQNGYTFYDELWSYEPESNTWTQLEMHNSPDPRFNTMLVYLPERHQLFLYGGMSSSDRADGTYIFDIETSTWTELHLSNQPSRRSDASIAYDPENDVVVLYSGYLQNNSHTQDTWIYSFTEENWLRQNPENTPLGQYGHYMVYAEETKQLLMYPGHWSIYSHGVFVDHGWGGNIWEYDVVDELWTEHESTPRPPGRYWGYLVYDSTENRLILFAGGGAVDYDDTWTYDIMTGTWEQATQTIKPSKRGGQAMTYDPENNIVVIFGGHSETGQSFGDTWILDCETLTWSQPETQSTEPDQTETEPTTEPIPSYTPTAIIIATILFIHNRRKSHKLL
jgi:N-acetylneuraminic acid mutarotase